MSSSDPTVLIVEDETHVAQLYVDWLADDYHVLTAYDGQAALSQLDESVDVVLLDRRMPGLSGDEVLDRIREAGPDCRVAMVTAVDPTVDIVDMEVDDYVTKPVSKDELLDIVEQLLRQATYDKQLQQYYSLAAKKAALDAELTPIERQSSEEYAALVSELEDVKQAIDLKVHELDTSDFEALMRDFPSPTDESPNGSSD